MYICIYIRCDLLQAVIKGPQDSPYADGLFFFDIQLPAEYPDVPPRVCTLCMCVCVCVCLVQCRRVRPFSFVYTTVSC